MARFPLVVLILLLSGWVLACQGDRIPSEPDRGLTVAGPGGGGVCKNQAFTAAAAIYTDSSVRGGKLQACKDILGLAKQNKLGAAELGIDALLVGIYDDYYAGAGLAPVGSASLPQSVANFAVAACGLAPLSASECLTPNNLDGDPGISADDLKGWLAAGPVSTVGAEGVLKNSLFAYRFVDEPAPTNAYIFIAQRPKTTLLGPCPGPYANDCEDLVHDVDVDGGFTKVAVESACASFGAEHVRCPEGGECQPGETTTELGLVDPGLCTQVGYQEMGFWRQFAFQATSPAQWLIRTELAHAGLTSKFGAFSPIVLAEDDPRRRAVICKITANYPSGSEGTICQLLKQGTVIASCTSVGTGVPYESNCPFKQVGDGENLLVPEAMTLLATANKTGTNGAYAAEQTFLIGPGNPERGESATVEFNLQPPGGGKGKNK